MGVSKVVYGGNTIIDLTSDTVSANKLLLGETAHGADGEPIVGTYEGGGGGGSNALYYDSEGHICIDYDVVKNGGSGGGGTNMCSILYYNSDGTILLNREYVRKGDDALYSYLDNEWSDEIGGTAIADIQEDIQSDLTLYFVGTIYLHYWDFTKSLEDTVTGSTATLYNSPTPTSDGLYIRAASQAAYLGDILYSKTSLYIEFGDMEFKGNTSYHETLISFGTLASSDMGLSFRSSGRWETYINGWSALNTSWEGSNNRNVFANKTLRISKDANNIISFYLDGQTIKENQATLSDTGISLGNSRGQSSGGQCFDVYIKKVYVIEDT